MFANSKSGKTYFQLIKSGEICVLTFSGMFQMHCLLLIIIINIVIVIVAEQMTAGNLVKTVGLASRQTSIEWR